MNAGLRTILDPLQRDLDEGRQAKDELKKAKEEIAEKDTEIAALKKKAEAEKKETRCTLTYGFLLLVTTCILLFCLLMVSGEIFAAFILYLTILMPMVFFIKMLGLFRCETST